MPFVLGKSSRAKLEGVHPDLVRVLARYLAQTGAVDVRVTEGVRTLARQRQLVAAGASKTLRSRHLTGHAIDLCGWIGGKPDYSWPIMHRIAEGMKAAAKLEGVALEWGGDWRTFKDGPHWQLSWASYPAPETPPQSA